MTLFNNINNKISLSFDIEDGISLSMRENFNTIIPQTERVVRCTERILDILSQNDTRSTFFVLGQVAEKFPKLIESITNEGHELAVHGYDHFTLDKLSPEQAFQEVSRAKSVIEDISGKEVYGHRAPAFSLTNKSSWMFDVLVEAGFKYDSSVLPASLGAFKWPDFANKISEVITRNGNSIIEVPISTYQIGKYKVPYSGGGYLRLIPEVLLKQLYQSQLEKDHVIHYMHPYEIDQERYPDYYYKALAASSLKKSLKMRSYWLNRSSLPSKLRMLSKNFRSIKMVELINEQGSRPIIKL